MHACSSAKCRALFYFERHFGRKLLRFQPQITALLSPSTSSTFHPTMFVKLWRNKKKRGRGRKKQERGRGRTRAALFCFFGGASSFLAQFSSHGVFRRLPSNAQLPQIGGSWANCEKFRVHICSTEQEEANVTYVRSFLYVCQTITYIRHICIRSRLQHQPYAYDDIVKRLTEP